MQYVIQPKVIEGDKCLVCNYRSRYKPWESGTVRTVSVGLRNDGSFRLVYEVLLDRRGGKPKPWQPEGTYLFLTVGDDRIEAVK